MPFFPSYKEQLTHFKKIAIVVICATIGQSVYCIDLKKRPFAHEFLTILIFMQLFYIQNKTCNLDHIS